MFIQEAVDHAAGDFFIEAVLPVLEYKPAAEVYRQARVLSIGKTHKD
jgi:hypothetical protein